MGQALLSFPAFPVGATIALDCCEVGPGHGSRFSFLLSIPAIGGAALLELWQLEAFSLDTGLGVLLVGTVSASVSGYLAVSLLLRLIRSNRMTYFSYYTWTVGLLLVLGSFLKGSGI